MAINTRTVYLSCCMGVLPFANASFAQKSEATPIYLLFERGKKKLYESIAVARFNLEWLVSGRDWRTFLKD